MLNNSLEDLQAAFMRVKNKEPKVDIHSKYLAAFSDLQEDYSIGCRKQDNNKLKDDGKGSKRRAAGKMERKAAFVKIQPRKKTELDSRIVRLSRLTGGKDRHSKVRTAKGLRDRRVRLSGPTAIQLYDLQERLCLEQPSMAVDWLIKAAKSAIDELNVLDAEMASAYAGNFAQLTSSNCSNVEHCVGSPRESATAAAASGLTAFRVDLTSPKAQGTDSLPAISGKAVSVMNLKQSDLGRSSSSISDGSIKGSAELTSNCSMSKPAASRREARIKARERARKKSAPAPNPVGPPLAFQQLNSMKPSSTSLFKRSFPYPMSSLESHSSNDDNPCGTHTKMLSGIDSVQQLWGYNNMQSYTEMCIQDSHLLQNMPSYSTVAIQKSLQPVPSTSASSYAVIESSCIDRTSEIADPTIPFFHPKKILQLGGNGAQGQTNLCYSSTPNMIMKRVEQQQQQQANIHIKHFGSTFVPTLYNDINISTSSLAGRGPLQSNTSSITNMASLSHSQNNAYGEASAKAARDFVALRDYDDSLFQEFHNAQDNVKYGHSQLWANEREHL